MGNAPITCVGLLFIGLAGYGACYGRLIWKSASTLEMESDPNAWILWTWGALVMFENFLKALGGLCIVVAKYEKCLQARILIIKIWAELISLAGVFLFILLTFISTPENKTYIGINLIFIFVASLIIFNFYLKTKFRIARSQIVSRTIVPTESGITTEV